MKQSTKETNNIKWTTTNNWKKIKKNKNNNMYHLGKKRMNKSMFGGNIIPGLRVDGI